MLSVFFESKNCKTLKNMMIKFSYLFKSIIDTGASPSQKAVPQAQKLEGKQHIVVYI